MSYEKEKEIMGMIQDLIFYPCPPVFTVQGSISPTSTPEEFYGMLKQN